MQEELPIQNTDEWRKVRLGKFTAFDSINLLKGGRKDMNEAELAIYKKDNPKGTRKTIDTLFGDTAMSYIYKKARELFCGVDESEELNTFDILRGRQLEPLAFKKLKELKELEFLTVERCFFFPFGDDAGASPDAVIGKNVGELKAPRIDKLIRLIALGKDAIDEEYIAQTNFQMMCSNAEQCHFFNYAIHNSKEIYHEIILYRDAEIIKQFKERLPIAVELRGEFLEKLNKNKQF